MPFIQDVINISEAARKKKKDDDKQRRMKLIVVQEEERKEQNKAAIADFDKVKEAILTAADQGLREYNHCIFTGKSLDYMERRYFFYTEKMRQLLESEGFRVETHMKQETKYLTTWIGVRW